MAKRANALCLVLALCTISAQAQFIQNWVPAAGITSFLLADWRLFWTVSDIDCPGGEFAQPCEINNAAANPFFSPGLSYRNNGPSAATSVHSSNLASYYDNVYYLGANHVYRARAYSPGSPPVALASLANNSGGEVAGDLDYIYWTENTGAIGRLYRVPRLGSGSRELMYTASDGPISQLKSDRQGGVLFVAGQTGFSIDALRRIVDNGTSFDVLVGPALVESYALDDTYVYMVNAQGNSARTLRRAPISNIAVGSAGVQLSPSLDGSQIEQIVVDADNLYYFRDRSGGATDFIYRLDKTQWATGTPTPITTSLANISLLQGNARFLFWRSGGGGIDRLDKEVAQPLSTDLSIEQVEVVQSVQTPDNFVRLTADKPTTVRVYTALNALAGATSVTATVALIGESVDTGGELSPPLPAQTIVMAAGFAVDRRDFGSTVNFVLPSSWTHDDVRLRARITPVALADTNPADNEFVEAGISDASLFFEPKTHVCIKFLPLHTTAGLTYRVRNLASGDYTPGFIDIVKRFESLYAARGLRFYTRGVALRKPEFLGFPQPFNMQESVDGSHVLGALWEHNLFDVAPEVCGGDNARTHYVGMVHPGIDTGTRLGQGTFAEPNSWSVMRTGGDDFTSHQAGSFIAHELGHNTNNLIGSSERWQHVNCGLPDGSDSNDFYPYRDDSIGVNEDTGGYWPSAGWGYDRLTDTIIAPDEAADYMSYCSPWVSSYRWFSVSNETNERSGFRGATFERGVPTSDVLSLFALLDEDETGVEVLAAHFASTASGVRVPALASKASDAPGQRTPTGTYTLELLNDSDAVLVSQPVEPVVSGEGEIGEGFLFYTTVGWDDETTGFRVRKNGQDVLASHPVSANPPTVTITAPLPGAVLLDGSTIEWSASDADGDDLTFLLQYSDDGTDWLLIAERLTETSLVIDDVEELISGPTGQLRVVASDGVRLGSATVTPLQVAPHPPSPAIMEPAPNAVFNVNDTITLRGRAFDADSLPENVSFLWQVNGPVEAMGAGNTLVLDRLPPGDYSATLTVVDETQNAREVSLGFSINPKVVPATAPPTLDGACSDDAYNDDTQPLMLVYAGGNGAALARAVRVANEMFVCVSGLDALSGFQNGYVSLQFDTDLSRDSSPQLSDNRIQVNGDGFPSRWTGAAGTWQPAEVGDTFNAVTDFDGQGWSAELRIDASLVGPPDGLTGVRIDHGDVQLVPNVQAQWPASSNRDEPSTYGEFALGLQDQAIDFNDWRIVVSAQPFDLEVTVSSMLPPLLMAQPESVCTTTSDGYLVPISTGRCTVTATQPGNEVYNPAAGVTRQIQVYLQDCIDEDDCDGDGLDNQIDNCGLIPNPEQIDADGDGFGNRCDFDYNDDCIVNAIDLGLFRNAFFGTDPVFDSNGDGVVNPIDLGAFRAAIFLPPGPAETNQQCF